MENISQMFKTLFEWRNYMVQIQVDKIIYRFEEALQTISPV